MLCVCCIFLCFLLIIIKNTNIIVYFVVCYCAIQIYALSLYQQKQIKQHNIMTNFKAIETVEEAMYAFALSYSWDNDLVFATQMGSDCIDTLEEVDLYEKEILRFVSGQKSIEVKRMNDDCTLRTEIVKFKLN